MDDLVATSEIGDWKMPDFEAACAYAASQGWLVVQGDALTLTTAGLAAAMTRRPAYRPSQTLGQIVCPLCGIGSHASRSPPHGRAMADHR
jgi:hypothetical protein